jgi:ketosteroid isomerase-like protein
MIRRNSLLSVLLLCGALSAQAAHPAIKPADLGEPATIRQILELEKQSKEAALRRDAGFAERTLVDDYVAIGPLGDIITKGDTVSARKEARLHYDSIDYSEMVVRIYGNTAVVTARADVKGKDLGEDFSGPYRFTRVWVKRNGGWQTVSYQMTVTH